MIIIIIIYKISFTDSFLIIKSVVSDNIHCSTGMLCILVQKDVYCTAVILHFNLFYVF